MFGLLGKQFSLYHGQFITEIVKLTGCETFLELGVYRGEISNMVLPYCKRVIGVDVKDNRIAKNGEFYEMTTDSFFEIFKDKVDIVFIDADHSFESVKKDFENSLKILNKYGIIILHDTDPITKQFTSPEFCGDSYHMIEYLEKRHYELNVVTLPFVETGITIVNRKNDRRVNSHV